jgi:hypothetical protein
MYSIENVKGELESALTSRDLSLFVTKADGPTPAHDLSNTKNNPLKIVNDAGTPQD